MPAIRSLTSEEEDWIRTRHPMLNTHEVADYLNCHVHTAIRILVRLGLMKAPCAKYDTSRLRQLKKCIKYRKKVRMHKNQRICGRCKSLMKNK